MAELLEGVHPGQESVLSLQCPRRRNKCQCQCPILLLASSLCHSASWAHCSGRSSITLCHVDRRMAVHLLTMWLLQRQSSAGSKYFTSCLELSKWTHNAHGRNHFHPSWPAHASASDPTISSEAETQSYVFNFLFLHRFLDQVWLTLTALCIAVKNSSIYHQGLEVSSYSGSGRNSQVTWSVIYVRQLQRKLSISVQ